MTASIGFLETSSHDLKKSITDHLLIDGKNALYRSIFAGYYDQHFKASGQDYFVIFLRSLASYLNKFKPVSAHIFWDAPVKTLWRKQIYPQYKEHRNDKYAKYNMDVKLVLKQQMIIALQILKALNVRQYFTDGQEADDLIYAFVQANLGKQITIISSDGDFKQIIFKYNNIKLINPLSKKDNGLEHKPDRDPVLVKALIGDKSDNISGYYGIGKTRVKPLVDDPITRRAFFDSNKAITTKNGPTVGSSLFDLNRYIVDLSLSPNLRDNLIYVEKQQTCSVAFDLRYVETLIQKYKVHGLMSSMDTLILPFKNLQ